ncbi:hypothetical protein [Poseidonibacter sp.]|uniref:hypothetical protein n=1 Tax=Poseidonibacter sp. TaxID=2321188 RepID=UPI003C76DD4D
MKTNNLSDLIFKIAAVIVFLAFVFIFIDKLMNPNVVTKVEEKKKKKIEKELNEAPAPSQLKFHNPFKED